MQLMKRLWALVTGLMLLCACAAAESPEDTIRKLLAAGETSNRPQSAVNDVQAMVDFDLIQQLNPECKGWLYQPESGFSAPVMQDTEEDEWYRERAFDEVKVYQTGSVYMTLEESLADRFVMLRGQARAEGCLGVLPQWQQQEYYNQHSAFRVLTPEGDYQADIFACVLVAETRYLKDWYPPETRWKIPYWLEDTALPGSLIQCDPLSMPDENDRILFIVGEHLNDSCTVVMTRLRPIVYTTNEQINLTKVQLDARETQNGMVEVGPAGQMMIYAQNDPLYATMRYESAIRNDVHRDFGGGGCGPTAMAMIAANLLDAEELPVIGQYSKSGLGTLFCTCSVNRVYCNHLCVPYQLQTPEEYLRYLPIAMADFAAGNNQWDFTARRVNSQGTNIKFVDYVCEAYGLTMETVNGLDTALEMMKEKTGEGLILTSALRGSPYTNNSHFVVIAAVDDEYFYVLDSLRRTEEEYLKTDTRQLLEVIAPGVTRIRLEDYGRSDLSPVCYISKAGSGE